MFLFTPSVDQIIAQFAQTVDKLAKAAQSAQKKAAKDQARAVQAAARALAANIECQRATTIKTKLEALISG